MAWIWPRLKQAKLITARSGSPVTWRLLLPGSGISLGGAGATGQGQWAATGTIVERKWILGGAAAALLPHSPDSKPDSGETDRQLVVGGSQRPRTQCCRHSSHNAVRTVVQSTTAYHLSRVRISVIVIVFVSSTVRPAALPSE